MEIKKKLKIINLLLIGNIQFKLNIVSIPKN
jgi:hypothetical protein